MPQTLLADKIGWSESHLGKVESGKRPAPNPDKPRQMATLEKIAKALHWDLADLVELARRSQVERVF